LSENLTKALFAESLKTKFRVSSEQSDAVEVELIELVEGVSTPNHEQFSLLFQGPQTPFLPQMTYRVEHDRLGEFSLFLVPVARTPDGFQYEAVFNRFPEGA
jgi:hypothetical protein